MSYITLQDKTLHNRHYIGGAGGKSKTSDAASIAFFDSYLCADADERICWRCGATVDATDRHCHDCGRRLYSIGEAEEEAPEVFEEFVCWLDDAE